MQAVPEHERIPIDVSFVLFAFKVCVCFCKRFEKKNPPTLSVGTVEISSEVV